jgi:transcriptional regulator with XRE-family HTH domain
MNKNNDFLAAAKASQKITIDYWQECLEEDGKSRYWLSKTSGISQSMLSDYWSGKVDMSLINYYRICGALKLRPYLIPADDDPNPINTVDFN